MKEDEMSNSDQTKIAVLSEKISGLTIAVTRLQLAFDNLMANYVTTKIFEEKTIHYEKRLEPIEKRIIFLEQKFWLATGFLSALSVGLKFLV